MPLRSRLGSTPLSFLDSLRADMNFGWRQILKRKTTSAAAILSLAIVIGACTSAFRLIDAPLRPLPVAGAERLYSVTFASPSPDGALMTYDSCSYPMFRRVRDAVKDEAEPIAISMYNGPVDLTFGTDQDMERVQLQYVSGGIFETFRLRPAAGRLLAKTDDLTPGAHPYAVLSYDLLDPAFRPQSRRRPTKLPPGRRSLRNRGCGGRKLQRHRAWLGYRRLRSDGDEESPNARQSQ